ncbi:MAG TPA: sigma-70 family RNA polymerase sigma factor [Steroidobacteraceae bacterium]|nr:sigma-70 family RNA polymerase sigma factor [Steroidobacteraceae bacterium]
MINAADGRDDRQRFEALSAQLRPELYRFAFWLARDRAIAEDVVQETLLRAWRSWGNLRDAGAAKQWLFTIARREHARLYERKRFETVDVDKLITSEAPALAAGDEREVEDLRRAIAGLEDDYREPLVLQVLFGYSTQEIASHMGLTQGAVLTRLFRARNQLRKQFGLEAVDDGGDET